MAAIDIGEGAIDRNSTETPTYTALSAGNPANATGTLTSFELWFNTNGSGVKVGTFYGAPYEFYYRDGETIGNVTAGSKQTFSGKNCDVTSGDLLGIYWSGGNIERSTSGTTTYFSNAQVDNFHAGAHDYVGYPNTPLSIYGIGATPSQTLYPSGISQVTALGTPQLILFIQPSSIVQAVAYGTPTVATAALIISPTGIEQVVALGTPAVQPGAVIISPSGIEQLLAYGTPLLNFILYPSGISQPLAYGASQLNLILYPSGISQPIVIGTPALTYPQTLSPQGIAQPIVIGTPSVSIYGFIGPSGIAQLVAIGSPALLKYVWHVILDGQYIAESPDINRAYVIGRDANGNPIYGEAHDSAESSLVGERLDFTQELAIPTTALAGDVASAILAKMRLTGKRGVILIPPNCGQELFDVVQVSDSMANQSAVTFRVVGVRFEYNPKQARYAHKLILGAP